MGIVCEGELDTACTVVDEMSTWSIAPKWETSLPNISEVEQ